MSSWWVEKEQATFFKDVYVMGNHALSGMTTRVIVVMVSGDQLQSARLYSLTTCSATLIMADELCYHVSQ